MMVGITARADCRGPNVLNGRRITTGSSNAAWKLSAILSAPIFDAEYGDCPTSGCDSAIGAVCAVPYTSDVEVCTTRPTPAARAASSTLVVPSTFVRKIGRAHV